MNGAAAGAQPGAAQRPGVLALPEKATFDEAAALAEALPAAVAGAPAGGALEVDASALKAYDSSTLSLLMQARRLAQQAGRGFSVNGAPAQLLQLAALYGVEELLAAARS